MILIETFMMRMRSFAYLLLILISLLLAGHESAYAETSHDDHDDHGDQHEMEEEPEEGPNHGRMLRAGDFAVEITIFEAGTDPQFRVYAYHDDRPLDPQLVDLTIDLGRLGGIVDHFPFISKNEFLQGKGVVTEPHSFDVTVKASYDGHEYQWSYASYEGRTIIDAQTASETGVEVEPVGPKMIEETIDVFGRINLAPGAEATLRARFPGQVMNVYKTVGDVVKAGEKLASIESNESLQVYDIVSPINGVVLERKTNVGNVANQEPLFIIGDITRLSVDFHVFPKDLSQVAPGQMVKIMSVNDRLAATANIVAFLPTKELETQTVIARALLSNPNKEWMPGMTVRGDIVIRKEEVPLAVRTEALQRFRDFTVVFAKINDTYEVRMLELGRQTAEWTEVLGGINSGQDYVVKNSFLIKADIEKDGAAHDH